MGRGNTEGKGVRGGPGKQCITDAKRKKGFKEGVRMGSGKQSHRGRALQSSTGSYNWGIIGNFPETDSLEIKIFFVGVPW